MGRKKYTTEHFIKLARSIHGDKYDYSKVQYVDMHTKVVISCPIHGEFSVFPYSHIKKGRVIECKQCSFLKRKLSYVDFKTLANKVHYNRYQYLESSFTGGVSGKVTIICPKHGEFQQRVQDHLRGFGCKKDGCAGKRKI